MDVPVPAEEILATRTWWALVCCPSWMWRTPYLWSQVWSEQLRFDLKVQWDVPTSRSNGDSSMMPMGMHLPAPSTTPCFLWSSGTVPGGLQGQQMSSISKQLF